MPAGGLALSRYEYQMSGWVISGGVASGRCSTRRVLGPVAGLSHSNFSGPAGFSGVEVLKFHL